MRIVVEQDFYRIKPDQDEHGLLCHAMQIQLDRHKAGKGTVKQLPEACFEKYVAIGYEVPRDPIRLDWPTVQPLIGALIYMGSNNHCTVDEADRTSDMIEQLHGAGEEYIEDYLDAILEKHLDTAVDVTYVVD